MSWYSTYLLDIGLNINSEFVSGQCNRQTELVNYCVHKIKINQLVGKKTSITGIKTENYPFIFRDRATWPNESICSLMPFKFRAMYFDIRGDGV